MTVKVLITEDHELYRDGLRLLLQEAFPAVQIIEAGDFSTAKLALASHQDIALVLFDIHIPGTTGLNGLAASPRPTPCDGVVEFYIWGGRQRFSSRQTSSASLVPLR